MASLLGPLSHLTGQSGGGGEGNPPAAGWILLTECELHIQSHVLVPDLAGWKRSELKVSESEFFRDPAISIPPTWCCEILSPKTAGVDKVKKRRVYLEIGVKYYWIVDPSNQLLEAYGAEGGAWKEIGVYSGEEEIHVAPFETVALNLPSLWVPRDDGTDA